MYTDLLIIYLIGFLITTDLLLAWFGTDFPAHLVGLGKWSEFKEWCIFDLGSRGYILYMLGKLLTCPICLSHWFAGAVAFGLCHCFGFPLNAVFLGIFTWPLLSFIVLKKLDIV